jgi:hypothetical protein
MTGGAYCDLFELALFRSGGATEARLYGRLNAGPGTGCTRVDEVEFLEGGASIATFEGAGVFASGEQRALLGRGAAPSAMTDRCAMEDRRFGGFGILVRGRYDGGSFEARCADAEGGGRWPPALRITCHEGVDQRPFSSYAFVTATGMFTSSTLDVTSPHGAGGALLGADMRVRVIPAAYSLPFGPPPPMIDPYDSDGWTGSVAESPGTELTGPYSQIHLTRSGAAFTTDLCPAPMPVPDPMAPPPPVFLVRITGTGERGPYSTEAYVEHCNTTSM